jgi:hypothetical protein
MNKGCMPHDYLGGYPETHLEILTLRFRFVPFLATGSPETGK